ncbi:MAG: zinc metallopeptidase [bacterium]
MFFFDTTYLWYVLIPTVVLSLGVQLYLKATVSKWSNARNSQGLTGIQVGQALFQRTSLKPIPLERTPGTLSDHYDPRGNVVRLSEAIANQPTVAAMAITAHELGHVEQHQTRSPWIVMRNILLPALQFSPMVSYIAILVGFWLNMTGLIWVGIAFFGLMVIFMLLTLPVEIDASRRGLRLLRQANLLQTETEAGGARQVLSAAALTYVAAAVTAVLQLLYYISLVSRRN